MGKCWFVLEQQFFKAAEKGSMRTNTPTGDLSLGHIFTDFSDMDRPINKDADDFVPIHKVDGPDPYHQIDYSNSTDRGIEGSAGLRASAQQGVDAEGSFHSIFTKARRTHAGLHKVDLVKFYAANDYLARSLERPAVLKYMRDNNMTLDPKGKSWVLWMITGMMIVK